ncbi:hypothetical protein CSUI_006560, partial [Cystoisospora suis]
MRLITRPHKAEHFQVSRVLTKFQKMQQHLAADKASCSSKENRADFVWLLCWKQRTEVFHIDCRVRQGLKSVDNIRLGSRQLVHGNLRYSAHQEDELLRIQRKAPVMPGVRHNL